MIFQRIHINRGLQIVRILIFIGLFCLPLLSISQSDSVNQELKFDFGLTRDRNINMWPVLRYYRTENDSVKNLDLFFPVFRYKNDKYEPLKKLHILPLFVADSSANGRDFRLFTLYYPSVLRVINDTVNNYKSVRFMELIQPISLLEFSKTKNGLFVENNLFFFIWYRNNEMLRKWHLIVFPLLWLKQTPDYKTSVFIPFYLRHNNTLQNKRTTAITPFYWHKTASREKSDLLIPFYWYKKTQYFDSTTRKTLLVAPLYWHYKDANYTDNVIFPLFWHTKSVYYKSFTLFPLYYRYIDYSDNRIFQAITPIFWKYSDSTRKNWFVAPLVIAQKKWDPDTSRFFHVIPVFWSAKSAHYKYSSLFPLYLYQKNKYYKSFTLNPLFSYGKSAQSNKKHIVITPLFWHVQSGKNTWQYLIPFWYAYKKINSDNSVSVKKVAFPVFWYVSDTLHKNITIFPVFSSDVNKAFNTSYLVITPLYWNVKSSYMHQQVLFPLYFSKQEFKRTDTILTRFVAPLYYSYRSNKYQQTIYFPVFWKFSNPEYKSVTVMPLFSYGKSPDKQFTHMAVTPFFWRINQPNQNYKVVFPIWWQSVKVKQFDTVTTQVLLPLYFGVKSNEKTSRTFFPIYFYNKTPDYKTTTIFPLVSVGKSSDSVDKHLMLTPFIWSFKHNLSNFTYIFPSFYRKRKVSYYDTTMVATLFPVVFFHNYPRYKTVTLFPLVSVGKSKIRKQNHLVITPLYWNFRKQSEIIGTFFPLVFYAFDTDTAYKRSRFILLPVVYIRKNRTISNVVAAPVLWKFNTPAIKSLTFFPLFTYSVNKYNLNKTTAITPLYWDIKLNSKHFNIFFPIWFLKKEPDKVHLNLILLYNYKKTPGLISHTILPPIFNYSYTQNYKYLRIMPLLWIKNTPVDKYVAIFPLYYQRKTTAFSDYRLAWILAGFKTEYGVKNTFTLLWRLYYTSNYRNSDFETRFLYLIYANVRTNGKTVKSLFPFYYFTKDAAGNRNLSVLLYFYTNMQQKIEGTDKFYKEERIFWFIRLRSNYRSLKNEGYLP